MTANALETLRSNVEIEEPRGALEAALDAAEADGRKLTVKLGVDPTAPDLHLGHAVVLEKLAQFQRAGHTIVLIIGDFTARIGDPTGRNTTRPPLTVDEINANAETYLAQLDKVLDVSKVVVRRNSEWLETLDLSEIIKLLSRITVAQIMQREDFKSRFRDNVAISMHELLYPIMQAYDSVAIDADVELGGTDQLFNNLMGRTLQGLLGGKQQFVLCLPLLVGTDGVEKMSKSKNNTIGLTEAPEMMFGKIMSISDEMTGQFVDLASDWLPLEKASAKAALQSAEANPMEIKLRLAENIVARFHGQESGKIAREHFRRTYQNKQEIDRQTLKLAALPKLARFSLVDLVAHVEPEFSRSHIRRLMAQSGVRVDGHPVTDPNAEFGAKPDMTVSIGKHKHFRLV